MLQPKRTKFRKVHKGRNTGLAQTGNRVSFGTIGVKVWIFKGEVLGERGLAHTPSTPVAEEPVAPRKPAKRRAPASK